MESGHVPNEGINDMKEWVPDRYICDGFVLELLLSKKADKLAEDGV